MALRPPDDDLPIPSERPKKQAKIAVTAEKQQPDYGVNDENKPPQATADASVDYIPSENLKPIADPEAEVRVVLTSLPAFRKIGFSFEYIIECSTDVLIEF